MLSTKYDPADALPYILHAPEGKRLPILLSVPHCGTAFPDELRDLFLPEILEHPDDTDFFVHDLYDFAPAMGITLIHSHYSRYVIDLNRDPAGQPLYHDGRVLTELVPTRSFFAKPLYRASLPDQAAIQERIARYYLPYHHQLRVLLDDLKEEFGCVLLWEAHSIRQSVPTLHPAPFPDLILGDQGGKTAHPDLSQLAQKHLANTGSYSFAHNSPFQGGYITRHFGQPNQSTHALQLEMVKNLYMDENTTTYNPKKAAPLRALLQQTLAALAEALLQRNASS